MSKPVRVRYRRDGEWPKGAEVVKASADDVPEEADILSYEDGAPFELNLREQAAARREETATVEPAPPVKREKGE